MQRLWHDIKHHRSSTALFLAYWLVAWATTSHVAGRHGSPGRDPVVSRNSAEAKSLGFLESVPPTVDALGLEFLPRFDSVLLPKS